MRDTVIRMGGIFDSYSKFRIFKRFRAIDSKFENSELYRLMSLEYIRKIGPGRSLAFWLNYEEDYNRQITPHISYNIT